jgi:hypothetical protein
MSLHTTATAATSTTSTHPATPSLTRLQDVSDDREAEGGCLAGPGLSAGHHVAASQANGNGVALQWRRDEMFKNLKKS